MLWNILLCAGLAAAVLALLWLLCAQFLLPIRAKNVWLVLVGRGSGETLEQDCRAYGMLKTAGALHRPLLLIDAGLNAEGRALAERLTTIDPAILLCEREELPRILDL